MPFLVPLSARVPLVYKLFHQKQIRYLVAHAQYTAERDILNLHLIYYRTRLGEIQIIVHVLTESKLPGLLHPNQLLSQDYPLSE